MVRRAKEERASERENSGRGTCSGLHVSPHMLNTRRHLNTQTGFNHTACSIKHYSVRFTRVIRAGTEALLDYRVAPSCCAPRWTVWISV